MVRVELRDITIAYDLLINANLQNDKVEGMRIFFRSCLYLLFVSAALIFMTEESKADTLYLSNGDVLSGNIISLHEGICVFNSKYGSVIQIDAKEITKLKTDNMYNITFESGEIIKGKFIISAEGMSKISSASFGEVPVPTSPISSMLKSFPKNEPSSSSGEVKTTQAERQETYGEKAEETPPLDFLTGSTVLLSPGTFELELDMGYKTSRSEYKLTQIGYFQRSAYSARMFETGLSLRAGILDGLEGWFRMPYTYSKVQDVSTNEFVRSKGSWDLGDLGAGFQYLLHRESSSLPAISASLSVGIPTGQKSYRRIENTWQDALDNGSGHWSISPGISFVRTVDPAIIYGGIDYQYSFARTIDGYYIKPGWGIGGYLGLGFALNEKLSLGARVAMSHYSELTADHIKVKGSDYDPMDLSFSFSYRAWHNLVISPQVTFGLNDDSGAPSVGVRFTRRF